MGFVEYVMGFVEYVAVIDSQDTARGAVIGSWALLGFTPDVPKKVRAEAVGVARRAYITDVRGREYAENIHSGDVLREFVEAWSIRHPDCARCFRCDSPWVRGSVLVECQVCGANRSGYPDSITKGW